jgi:hypothetical protein
MTITFERLARQKFEWRQNLVIPVGTNLRSIPILIGKGLALLLLGLVDDLPGIGCLEQPRETVGGSGSCTVPNARYPFGRPQSKALIDRR